MRKSKARIVVELLGPTDLVRSVMDHVVATAREQFSTVQASFPEPCTIEPVLRNRKKVAPKPERKARSKASEIPLRSSDDPKFGAVWTRANRPEFRQRD